MSGNRSIFSTSLIMTVLVLLHTGSVRMSSDPSSRFCAPVCWDEDARAEECLRRRGCNPGVQGREEFIQCSDECYSPVATCQMRCRESFGAILDVCAPNCTDPERYGHCVEMCFTHSALVLKHEQGWTRSEQESARARRRRLRRMRNLLRGASGFRRQSIPTLTSGPLTPSDLEALDQRPRSVTSIWKNTK